MNRDRILDDSLNFTVIDLKKLYAHILQTKPTSSHGDPGQGTFSILYLRNENKLQVGIWDFRNYGWHV